LNIEKVDGEVKVRVYDADSSFPHIGAYLRETFSHLSFAIAKAKLDLRAINRNTWLGQLWNILNPLLLSLVYWLLVVVILGGGGSIFSLEGVKTLTQIVAGLFLFRFISIGLMTGAKSIVSGGAFVLNTRLPRIILPLSAVYSAFLSFLPSMFLYAIFHIVSQYPITPELLLLVLVVLLSFLLTTGLAMLAATGNVFFRDIASFLPYVTRIWLYLTPVIYIHTDIPESYRWLIFLNPIGALFVCWQQILFLGEIPGNSYLLAGVLWSTSLFLLGFVMFLRKERDFAIRI
tara:strand:- start:2185 stop:3051 length:867 start_codon:yes stop_codon:yes gene_type:complete